MIIILAEVDLTESASIHLHFYLLIVDGILNALFLKNFTHYKQLDQMDCGPTCLRMVAKHYGKNFSLQKLREICSINKNGVSLLGISQAAEKIGFQTIAASVTGGQLKELNLPIILHWRQNHFVVLYKISGRQLFSSETVYYIADPSKGLIQYLEKDFYKHWIQTREGDERMGIILNLVPTPNFYKEKEDKGTALNVSYILGYLKPYRKLLVQLFLGLSVGSILQLVFPFLTQSVVDIGINTKNIGFLYIILIAQTTLFVSQLSIDFIRSWILLNISMRINISILTDFLIKLMKLPMSFFDTKMTGDILQRMADQKRIESFLTGSTLSIIFSSFNFIVFSIVLAYYSTVIFGVFLISSVIFSLWTALFLSKRREINFKQFDVSSKNQNSVVQLISGMQEIKLTNSERQKRWEWEHIQADLFKLNVRILSLGQYQQTGSFLITEGKNILITFLVAKSVIEGHITLGGMMAVQYVVAQLNSPIEQFLSFIQQFQDAKISLERLSEIQDMDDEEPSDKIFLEDLPSDKSISLNRLSFAYPGAGNEPVLSDINLHIPEGKTTAIVGMSGSGKTTILKLLLRFYEPQKGEIRVGNSHLDQISYHFWRNECGTVMQDGFIFSDTVAKNIAVLDEYPDVERLRDAIHIANIGDFIDSLPLGVNTKIGAQGNGISQGQRQRLLIARAVYKDPKYLFFDEATNALDANNEKIIIENLSQFFKGRTVVIVAHRLSTVRDADNIIVLEKGIVIEEGNHLALISKKGRYFDLVKNQLELGL